MARHSLPRGAAPTTTSPVREHWYPNRICNGAVGNPRIQEWFNPACFPSAALGTYGDSGRHILFEPEFFNMNTPSPRTSRFAGLVKREHRISDGRERRAQPSQLRPTQRVNRPCRGGCVDDYLNHHLGSHPAEPTTRRAHHILALLPAFALRGILALSSCRTTWTRFTREFPDGPDLFDL